MFLKSVSKLKMISIRTRLTLFYTLAAFFLLTAITSFLYWETRNILYKADYQFLAEEVDTLQYILNDKFPDLNELKKEVVEIPLEPDGSMYRYYIRVLNENKKLIIETPGINTVLPPINKLTSTAELLGKKSYKWYSANGNNYLLIQSPVHFSNKKIGFIQIALDTTYQQSMVSDRKEHIVSLIISTFCALILSFFIAHRATRSLFELTTAAKKISATSLHERLDPASWPVELRELGFAFNQMLERIELSFLRLKQFSADLAHELRTPISNLIGTSEIILAQPHSKEEYRQVIESNLEEMQRLSQIMENILFLSRAENPKFEIEKKILSTRHEIELVCEFYQAMAEEKQINIICEGQADCSAHPVMFKRVISNLLSNALKYSRNNSVIRINIVEAEDNIFITISDSGIGIAPEHLPYIFDRFYRADAARSEHSGGVGLGLAIVKSIVELHQGNIAIESKEAQGTVVSLAFPK